MAFIQPVSWQDHGPYIAGEKRHSFKSKNGFGEHLHPHLLSYLSEFSECYDPHLNTSAI